MTLTITDCGDEWQYQEYNVTHSAERGLSVEVTGNIEDLPWVHAIEVVVHFDIENFTGEYRGWVDCPESVVEDAGMTVTAVVAEDLAAFYD